MKGKLALCLGLSFLVLFQSWGNGEMEKQSLDALNIRDLRLRLPLEDAQKLDMEVPISTKGFPSDWPTRIRVGLYYPGTEKKEWESKVKADSLHFREEIFTHFDGIEVEIMSSSRETLADRKIATAEVNNPYILSPEQLVELTPLKIGYSWTDKVLVRIRIPKFDEVFSFGKGLELLVFIVDRPSL